MLFENIYQDVLKSFGGIWRFKERGGTLEIITPFATTSKKFVSVFLSFKNNSFIVSDGGWINDGVYENEIDIDFDCYNKVFYHYLNSYNIKETKGTNNKLHFYKITDMEISIPSLVLDMSQFITGIINASAIEYTNDNDTIYKKFRGIANNFISSIVGSDYLDTTGYLDSKDKSIKVNAIIRIVPDKMVLVNYISGVSTTHFTNSMARANFMFEMAEKSIYKPYISKKISFVDDTSRGFTNESPRLDFMVGNTHSIRVDWTQKNKFESLLN